MSTEDVPVTRVHDLKVWPIYFEALVAGNKTFEVRYDDRGYSAGDTLILREWDDHTKVYTGREVRRLVTYITRMHQKIGYVVMGMR